MMSQEVWTVGRILRWTQDFFAEKDIPSPRLDAEVLLAHALKKERIYLYVHFDEPLNPDELKQFRELVKGRANRISVAHLTGRKEFMGLGFKVNEHTLVPRPETEILVQGVLERLKRITDEEIFGADIGTGTGAIALSLVKYNLNLTVQAVDISSEALAVAKENAGALKLSDRVEFLHGNMLEPLNSEKKLHFIASNPPYIPTADIVGLDPEVRREPQAALNGGADGLAFYRYLSDAAPPLLLSGGFLAVEVGAGQSRIVADLMQKNLLVAKTEILPDLAGIERVVIAWV